MKKDSLKIRKERIRLEWQRWPVQSSEGNNLFLTFCCFQVGTWKPWCQHFQFCVLVRTLNVTPGSYIVWLLITWLQWQEMATLQKLAQSVNNIMRIYGLKYGSVQFCCHGTLVCTIFDSEEIRIRCNYTPTSQLVVTAYLIFYKLDIAYLSMIQQIWQLCDHDKAFCSLKNVLFR